MQPHRPLLVPPLLAVLLTPAALAQGAADEAAARAAIEAKTAAWAEAMVGGTVPDLIPALFTEGAVRMGAGRQQRGREAILEHARTFPRYAGAAFELDDLVVVGDVAYGAGGYTIETLEGDEGEGTYLKVWRREGDGEWRIDRIMFQ